MRSGVAYLHPRPASPIDGTGSALLPTPAARDFRDLSAGKAFLSQRKRHSPSLATKLLERGVHWTMLDGLRGSDGVSVAMERRRIGPLGNAVIPQFPELIGNAILAARAA
jgi:hypothetical protein